MRIQTLSPILAAAAICAVTSLAVPGPVEAASFDCGQARTSGERAICGNRGLEDRDVKMATLYGVVRQFQGGMGALGAIRDRQAAWLVERNRCASDVACLRRVYDRRITELERAVAAAAGSH